MSRNQNARSGIATVAGLLAVATVAAPSVGQAASEARRIAMNKGQGIQVVTRSPGTFTAAALPSVPADEDTVLEDQANALSVLVEQFEGDVRPSPVPIFLQLETVPVLLLGFCERGLFGHVTNAPCRIRPDATILNRR